MAGLLTLEGRACAWYTDTRREGPRMYFEDFMSKFTELPIACYVSRRTGEDMASGRWYKRHLHREFEVLYLESGDTVILISDGIAEEFYERPELLRAGMERLKTENPTDLATGILELAVKAAGAIRDDMTVLVVSLYQEDN